MATVDYRTLRKSEKSAIIASKGGATMADRDYRKEYEREREQGKKIGVKVTPEFFNQFTEKTEQNGTNKNAVLKACAEAYVSGNLIIDENGKPQIVS